ncbi:putative NACHT, LRR and PYD domains-containing protein 3 [Penaeus vannamei]|uniref:Putative NACHT, LRR and PYD domains-containing protein 3 n=1 Tax=Penaeus vannamei TaxID=6689 RepID=A0A423SIH2_PENVA|nr:putative NACHT, LRR and PYD domains-containing protein 3 [Penaeus vannamei]
MATQQQPSRSTRLTRHSVNGFRYQVAVITKGRAVFVQAVEWLYQGGPCVKTHFLSLGNSRADYKRKFNSEQRALLEKGAPFKEFDISLLYNILQLMCGLASPSNPVWTSPPSGQPLEHLLHKLKLMRNHIAHTNDVQEMSDEELLKKLRKLKCLLSRILRLTGNRCGIHPHIFRDQVWEIKQYFQGLLQRVREPLESSDLNNFPQLQQEIRVFQEALRSKIEGDSRQELHDLYPQLWDVTLAQWLYPDLKIQPSLNFTNLVIVEDTSTLSPSQEQKHQPSDISHENLLQVKQRNGRLPEVIIISGEGGIGKTTLLKHMLEMWVRDPSQIEGLQDASLLLYLQLRGCTISSWNDLLISLVQNTFQGSGLTTDVFVDLFLAMNIVVLLDGYDEVSKKAKKLITDLLCYPGNMRIVITTRPGCAKELTQIMKNKRQVINVEIKGIRREDRPHFVESTLAALVQDPTRREEMKEKIVTNMKTINLEKGKLDIPLTLTLAIIREVETPGQSSPDIYGDLTALMMDKIRERLARKGIDDVDEKVQEYHEFQKAVALQGLKTPSGMEFLPESLRELKTNSDGEGMMALLKRLALLPKLRDLDFSGSLTKVEIELLPKVLLQLDVTTDGEGLRALARRLPHLKYLYNLNICLLDCPPADTLLDLPYEGFLKLNLRQVTPPHWLWVCDALQKLLTTRTEKAFVTFPPCCGGFLFYYQVWEASLPYCGRQSFQASSGLVPTLSFSREPLLLRMVGGIPVLAAVCGAPLLPREEVEEELVRRETISVRSFMTYPTEINVERTKVYKRGRCTVT